MVTRVLVAARALSLIGKRTISTLVCVWAHEGIVKSEDYALPIFVDQCDCPLPAMARVRLLSASQEASKEKTDWSSLSRDDRVQLYHIQFYLELCRDEQKYKQGEDSCGLGHVLHRLHCSYSDVEKTLCKAPSLLPLMETGWPCRPSRWWTWR